MLDKKLNLLREFAVLTATLVLTGCASTSANTGVNANVNTSATTGVNSRVSTTVNSGVDPSVNTAANNKVDPSANAGVNNKVSTNANANTGVNSKTDTSLNTGVNSGVDSEINDDLNTNANNADPYQNYNRHAYKLNDKIDKVIIKPIARVYNFVLPKPAIKGITNFFNNIGTVPTIINDLLQGQFKWAGKDSCRFVMNSTIGVAGLIDVASEFNLPRNDQDFGLTLAKWGYKQSNYVVLPILGPSTVRDTLSLPVGYFTSPISYIRSPSIEWGTWGLVLVNTRTHLLKYDAVLDQAFDPYVFMRDAYLQRRNYQINGNSLNESASNGYAPGTYNTVN